MIIGAKTFRKWLEANLDKSALRDLAEHGADAGFPGLTYYSNTIKVYDRFHDEIWEALDDDAKEFGCRNIFDFIAGFNRTEASSDAEFKNLLVWYMAEREAARILERRE